MIGKLRDLARCRQQLVQDRTREGERVDRVMKEVEIMLPSGASWTSSQSGRAMIDALVGCERDPAVLAGLAKKRWRSETLEWQRRLIGRLGDHHAAVLRLHLALVDHLDALIALIDDQIGAELAPFAAKVPRDRPVSADGRADGEHP